MTARLNGRRHKAALRFECPNCGAPAYRFCDRQHRPGGWGIAQATAGGTFSRETCPERLALIPRPLPATQPELNFDADRGGKKKGGGK